MSTKDIVLAWKNEAYLSTLSLDELSALPKNPAGDIELRSYANTRSVSFIKPLCGSVVIECSASNCA